MVPPTIVTCAVTGNITTRKNNPNLPVTPEEIARDCVEAGKAGAAIAHIHVRDPQTGAPSMDVGLYRQVTDLIRAAGSNIIINLTTGPGGRFVPSDAEPSVAAPGTTLLPPGKRIEHVVQLKPEICSLDLNTMVSGSSIVINTPRNVRLMAEAIRDCGVRPELEVFDSGDIELAKHLIAEGVIDTPALFQIVLGIRFGAPARPETLLHMRDLLPPGSMWAAFGIGRMAFPVVAQSWLMGGHVRVGLEDNIYLEKGVLAPSNAALVEKAIHIVKNLGGHLATPEEARDIIGLPHL